MKRFIKVSFIAAILIAVSLCLTGCDNPKWWRGVQTKPQIENIYLFNGVPRVVTNRELILWQERLQTPQADATYVAYLMEKEEEC